MQRRRGNDAETFCTGFLWHIAAMNAARAADRPCSLLHVTALDVQVDSVSRVAEPVRTGVVGFGLAGRVFHASFIAAVPALSLDGIVQRTGDDAARAYPAATVYRSLEELLASDVELVVVATPNETHVDFATAALRAGKHVVIDKAFAPTLDAALRLERLANEAGRLAVPFHNRRFDGDFLTLRRLLHGGELGRAVTLRSRFDRFRPIPRGHTWKEAEGSQNGLLMDLGPHLVDQALALFGRPRTVCASVRKDRDNGAIEDAFDIALVFEQQGRSVRAELGATMLAAVPEPRFRLEGTLGSYVKVGLDPQEPAVVAGAVVPRMGSGTDWLSETEDRWGMLTTAADPSKPGELQTRPMQTDRGDYRMFYQAVADAIQNGTEPPLTARDAVRVARMLEMARESSRTGTTLSVQDKEW